VSAWRSLLHAIVAMPMDGLPGAILAPEDQHGSDHRLGRLRATLELPPPALDEDLQIHTGGLDPDDYERWFGDLLVAALLVEDKP
jgi:hypothetical protein